MKFEMRRIGKESEEEQKKLWDMLFFMFFGLFGKFVPYSANYFFFRKQFFQFPKSVTNGNTALLAGCLLIRPVSLTAPLENICGRLFSLFF